MTQAGASIAEGARQALLKHLLDNPKLQLPQDVLRQRDSVTFTPDNELPFLPTNLQMSESSSSLWALLAMFSNTIAGHRYEAEPDHVVVDVYGATLFLMSAFLYKSNGKKISDPYLSDRTAPLDYGNIRDRYRGFATNIYLAKDRRFYHLHGSLDTTPTMNMLKLPQLRPDLTDSASSEELKAIYANEVAKYDSTWLDVVANEHWRQAGTVCYTFEEFARTPHGKVEIDEPLYTVERLNPELAAPSWPAAPPGDVRPLAGIRVLDLTRVIAGPTISRVLSLLGADVLRISGSGLSDTVLLYDTQIGKRDTTLNLKSVEGKRKLMELVEGADVFLDGFRPGALDRLGFSRKLILETARRRGVGIIHARENCYGWKGEWSSRSGWQQISDAVSGATWAQGKFLGLEEPVIPLLPNSDYQTGLVGAIAIAQALFERATSGGSYAVDTSLTQYNIWFQQLGLFDEPACEAIRARNPGIKLRHNTELPVMVNSVKQSTQRATSEGIDKMWDPSRFVQTPMEWSKENELGSHLDWTKIVQFTDTTGAKQERWAHQRGSCQPGSHPPTWL